VLPTVTWMGGCNAALCRVKASTPAAPSLRTSSPTPASSTALTWSRGSRWPVSSATSSSLPITTSTQGSTVRAARPASSADVHELGR